MAVAWTGSMTGVRQHVADVLHGNLRSGVAADGVPYSYTRPDPVKFPDQFYWDSCLIALAWSRLDVGRAREELRTLARAQRPDGHIGHTLFWAGPVRAARAPVYNVVRRSDRMTATIQPPLLGWVWAEVADRSPDDPGFRREGLEVVRRHHRWLEAARGHADGLLGILQPDESGLDATPAYDAPLGWRAHPYPGFALLVRANRRRGFDYRAAAAAGAFTATDVLVNAAWALSWHGLARLGEPGGDERALRITRSIEDHLWDSHRRCFFPRGPLGQVLPVTTWAGLSPLVLPGLDSAIADALIDDQLLRPDRFWTAYPVPSVSQEEPSFRAGDTGWPIRRYWRGPSWPFTWWFLHRGLRVHGRPEAADELAARAVEMVRREGLREYYDPLTGRGLGGRRFAVSGVVAELMGEPRPDG